MLSAVPGIAKADRSDKSHRACGRLARRPSRWQRKAYPAEFGTIENGRGRGTARVDGYDLCRRQPRRCRCRTAQSAITLDAERRSGGGGKLGERIGSRDSLAKRRRLDVDRTHARPFCGSRQHFITKRCSPSGPGEERIASSPRVAGVIEWCQTPSGCGKSEPHIVLSRRSRRRHRQLAYRKGILSGQSVTRRANLSRHGYLADCERGYRKVLQGSEKPLCVG
jgi:hypothetical protein